MDRMKLSQIAYLYTIPDSFWILTQTDFPTTVRVWLYTEHSIMKSKCFEYQWIFWFFLISENISCKVRVISLRCSSWQQSQEWRKVWREIHKPVSLFNLSMMLDRIKYVPQNSRHEIAKHFRGRPGNLSESDVLFVMYDVVDVALNSPDEHKVHRWIGQHLNYNLGLRLVCWRNRPRNFLWFGY